MHCDIYTPLLPFSVKPNPFFQTSPLAPHGFGWFVLCRSSAGSHSCSCVYDCNGHVISRELFHRTPSFVGFLVDFRLPATMI